MNTEMQNKFSTGNKFPSENKFSTKDHFFTGHMMDLADRAFQGNYPVFTDFLTTAECMLLISMEHQMPGITVMYWGGHRDCDHVIGGFFPEDWKDAGYGMFPVTCIRTAPQNDRYAQSLEHRDYLGAILNLGIARCKIGDIRICDHTAYIFCKEEFASFVVENFTNVKHTPVACEILSEAGQIPAQQYTEYSRSVASPRLDNIVAAMTGLSRGKASELIRQGYVIADHLQRTSVSFSCTDKMIFTIRGYGKFRVFIPEGSLTKKGKQKITIYKYI